MDSKFSGATSSGANGAPTGMGAPSTALGHLVLKVNEGEALYIGDAVIRCYRDGKDIKLWIDAPKSVNVHRESAKTVP